MRKPYFYVIEDVTNGKLYAGSKFGADADPSTFWVEGGYTTSSETINELVEEDGLERFVIRKLKPVEDAYNYETKFLVKVDAKNNPKFYNGHNNTAPPPPGTPGYREMMIERFGVEHLSQLQSVRDKIGNTLKGYVKSEEAKRKQSETRKERIRNGEIVFQTGPKHSEETRKKLSLAASARYGEANGFFGKSHSEETKKKLSEASSRKIECPHCGKWGQQSVMKRWHFDRCRNK